MRWDATLAPHRAALEAARRPGVAMQLTPARESSFRRGASRVGGSPDLLIGTPWPTAARGERVLPLAFLAQIRLEDVAAHDRERRLPANGLLSFFVLDSLFIHHTIGWTAEETKRTDRVRVVHTPADTLLERRAPPADLPADRVLAPQRPSFRRVETWPQIEGSLPLQLDAAATTAWAEQAPENPRDQLLGHPCGCEFPIGRDPEAELLLSLEARPGRYYPASFGRNGFIFVGISRRDLADRAWERAFHKEW